MSSLDEVLSPNPKSHAAKKTKNRNSIPWAEPLLASAEACQLANESSEKNRADIMQSGVDTYAVEHASRILSPKRKRDAQNACIFVDSSFLSGPFSGESMADLSDYLHTLGYKQIIIVPKEVAFESLARSKIDLSAAAIEHRVNDIALHPRFMDVNSMLQVARLKYLEHNVKQHGVKVSDLDSIEMPGRFPHGNTLMQNIRHEMREHLFTDANIGKFDTMVKKYGGLLRNKDLGFLYSDYKEGDAHILRAMLEAAEAENGSMHKGGVWYSLDATRLRDMSDEAFVQAFVNLRLRVKPETIGVSPAFMKSLDDLGEAAIEAHAREWLKSDGSDELCIILTNDNGAKQQIKEAAKEVGKKCLVLDQKELCLTGMRIDAEAEQTHKKDPSKARVRFQNHLQNYMMPVGESPEAEALVTFTPNGERKRRG